MPGGFGTLDKFHPLFLLAFIIKMSQEQVYQFLKEHKGKWFVRSEIAESINLGPVSTTNNLRRLTRSHMVSTRININNKKIVEYSYKESGGLM